jgi:hypothetical protein
VFSYFFLPFILGWRDFKAGEAVAEVEAEAEVEVIEEALRRKFGYNVTVLVRDSTPCKDRPAGIH